MDLNMALIRCQPTCFRLILLTQRVGLRVRIETASGDERIYCLRDLSVCVTNPNLTTQPAKPYHVMFEKEAFSCL